MKIKQSIIDLDEILQYADVKFLKNTDFGASAWLNKQVQKPEKRQPTKALRMR